jgi:hypothetical protein
MPEKFSNDADSIRGISREQAIIDASQQRRKRGKNALAFPGQNQSYGPRIVCVLRLLDEALLHELPDLRRDMRSSDVKMPGNRRYTDTPFLLEVPRRQQNGEFRSAKPNRLRQCTPQRLHTGRSCKEISDEFAKLQIGTVHQELGQTHRKFSI